MTNNIFNDALKRSNKELLTEAVNKLWEIINQATVLESTEKFLKASEDKRQQLVDAIYDSQNVFYKCQVLQTAQINNREDYFDTQELEHSGETLNAAIASLI